MAKNSVLRKERPIPCKDNAVDCHQQSLVLDVRRLWRITDHALLYDQSTAEGISCLCVDGAADIVRCRGSWDDLIPKLGLGMHQGTDLVPTSTPLRGSPSGPSAGEPKGGEGEVDLGPSDANTDIKYHGTPTPGARVSLGLSGSNAPGTTYYWRQVEGPRVAIDDPTKPHVSFTIPQGARRLRFLLELKGPRGESSLRVLIPIAATSSQDRSLPVADAGDDQIGLSGAELLLAAHGARRRIASRVIAGSRSPVRK